MRSELQYTDIIHTISEKRSKDLKCGKRELRYAGICPEATIAPPVVHLFQAFPIPIKRNFDLAPMSLGRVPNIPNESKELFLSFLINVDIVNYLVLENGL